MSGFIPLFHTIAPFLVERAYEQLKVDFCYQKLGGNFVTVGASYDYAGLGCTHHAPGDVSVLSALPNMEIVVPGSSSEFDKLFRESYANGNPTYYRLSERECKTGPDCEFGRGVCLRSGNRGTIIAVGPMLDAVLAATANLDVTILYYSTITPFDVQLLRANARSETVIIVEPFYEGTLVRHVAQTLSDRPVRIHSIGVPNRFLTHYGSTEDHDVDNGLTPDHIHARLEAWLES